MREFLLLVHRVPVQGQFTLNDLAGGAGRMDEVARCVSTAFTLSNDLRRDTHLTLLFARDAPPGARKIELRGDRLRHLNPDERSTAALLKNALVRSIPLGHPVEASPGLRVGPADPATVLSDFVRAPGTVWLTEEGAPLREAALDPESFRAVLSDPFDPSPSERELLVGSEVPSVSVGPRSLRTSQVLDVVQNELDLRGRPSPVPRDPSAERRPERFA